MPTTLIGRIVLLDLVKVTLLATTAISALLVGGGAMVEANKLGLDPTRVLRLLPLLLPPTLPYTLPVSLLFATTFVYSRLSANQEIVALKAGGVHAMRILAPGISLALLVSGGGIYLSDQFIPQCHQTMNRMIMEDLESSIYSYLKQTGSIARPDFPYEIFVQDVRNERLVHATFKHRANDGRYDFVAQAEEATLEVVQPAVGASESTDPVVNIRLINHVVLSKEGRGRFQDQTYQMPMPQEFATRELKSDTLTSSECRIQAREHLRQSNLADFDLAIMGAWGSLQGDNTRFAGMMSGNRVFSERQARKSREMYGETHSRWAQSFAALGFVLLGGPVGILFQRRDFLQTFFVCFLPIVLIYYPAMVLAQNLIKEGIAPPSWSTWTPVVVLILVSFPLLRRVIRH